MVIRIKKLAALLLVIFALPAFAQKSLVEGVVTYNAVTTNPEGVKSSGVYSVTVKNQQVRKDLKLANSENAWIVDNSDVVYTLRSSGDKKYAVEVKKADFNKRHEKYADPVIKDADEHKMIAGLKAEKAIVTYKDGSSVTVYYTKEWLPDAEYTFERFRGLKGFPLAFEYKNSKGITTYFEATSLQARPVESTNFKVPAAYKIISNEEYKQLKGE